MNTFFNAKRFGLLMRQDLLLNRNKYLLEILILALAIYTMLVYLMIVTSPYYSPSTPYQGFVGTYLQLFVLFMIGLGIFVGISFSDLSNKVKRTSYLLVPASNFEKFLYPFLLRGVIGTVLYFLIFWVVAQLARYTAQSFPAIHATGLKILPFEFSIIFQGNDFKNCIFMVLAFLSLGTYLYSIPLFFRKMALLKTIVSIFVVAFIYTVLMVLLTHLFYPNILGFEVHCDNYMVTKQNSNWDLLVYYFASISWIFLLLIGYFKLKEQKL